MFPSTGATVATPQRICLARKQQRARLWLGKAKGLNPQQIVCRQKPAPPAIAENGRGHADGTWKLTFAELHQAMQ